MFIILLHGDAQDLVDAQLVDLALPGVEVERLLCVCIYIYIYTCITITITTISITNMIIISILIIPGVEVERLLHTAYDMLHVLPTMYHV